MHKNELENIIAEVATRILEDAAFIFTEKLDDNDLQKLHDWQAHGVSLSFSGTPSGTVHLWASESFSRFASSNMLGIEETDANAAIKGLDALKELLNIIVGNLLTDAFGSKPFFHLGLPAVLDKACMKADINDPSAVWLKAENNLILFTVHVEKN